MLTAKQMFLLLGFVTIGLVIRNFLSVGVGNLKSNADVSSTRPRQKTLQDLMRQKKTFQSRNVKSSSQRAPLSKFERQQKWASHRARQKECIFPSVGKGNWRKVDSKDLESIRKKAPSSIITCEMRGDAMVMTLNLQKAQSTGGYGYEMPFPHYIVADESGSWRRQRSTLQLFTVDQAGAFHPMGPPHSLHTTIKEKGNGAYSHWRHPLHQGSYGSSNLRFSTPGNVPLGKVHGMVAVVFPFAPPMGWIEFNEGKRLAHQELFREMFLQTFPTLGISEPHLIDKADDTHEGTRYVWRVGGNGEFKLPLKEGELYEKRLPYQIEEWYGKFEKKGGILFPNPESYVYYQNKVGLARLFRDAKIKTPNTWVFTSLADAEERKDEVEFPVVIKDPYGFSSLGLQQAADATEFSKKMKLYFDDALVGVEAIVQSKVVALREARITYVDGRPFHGYWRIRQSIKSASAASNLGGYQDFNFPLDQIAPYVKEFAEKTRVPVGGVDFIWQEAKPDVKQTPFTLEVSPTSDINPPAPSSWKGTYAEFKHTPGYHTAYLEVRRQWTDLMGLAVIDRYRREKRHLFVDIDNVVSLSMERVRRLKGKKEAYAAHEVMKDRAVPGAVDALTKLREHYYIRFLTARGSYEDPFNVTQTWLEKAGFSYDELIVVDGPESKVAHMSPETLLVDDFTLGHETPTPFENTKFMARLDAAKLPYVVFPLGGSWDDVMPALMEKANELDLTQDISKVPKAKSGKLSS
eukprot:TRINITY_DN23704_c1_g1_i1.p1 TRINITY_DN23704_c1_g1~~TRINITY_DN23704_c1_g1_i1.p1  ORF type:complete len:747 (+),score=128.95 TRINITY_DN23704_c1_g1_i1:29-2269(+)